MEDLNFFEQIYCDGEFRLIVKGIGSKNEKQ